MGERSQKKKCSRKRLQNRDKYGTIQIYSTLQTVSGFRKSIPRLQSPRRCAVNHLFFPATANEKQRLRSKAAGTAGKPDFQQPHTVFSSEQKEETQ